jgi:uracil-DNA glycosylase family 4
MSMAQRGVVLSEDPMAVFAHFMSNHGFKKKDFALASSIRCGYDPTEHPSKDRHVIEKRCREWLLRIIERMKPKVIVPLGADAAKAVAGRSVKITKVRGSVAYDRQLETHVLPFLDPYMVFRYPQHESTFNVDCSTLRSFVDSGYKLNALQGKKHGSYEFVDDLQYLVDLEPEYLSFDLETVGTNWFKDDGKICTMQFCTEPGSAQMLVWDHPERPMPRRKRDRIKAQLKKILQNPKTSVFGQNLKFDRLWVEKHLGIKFRIDHDTLMLAAIVDENMLEKNQDNLVKLYVPEMAGYADKFNQTYDKSRMDLVPLNKLIEYGCGDVDANFRLLDKLLTPVENDDLLWAHYRHISIPGINAFASIEPRGMLVDEDALDDLQEELQESQEEARKSLLAQIPTSIKQKHASHDKNIRKSLSFTRKAFLVDVLFGHKDGFRLKPKVWTKSTANLRDDLKVPSTSTKDHLPYFFDDCPFTLELAEYIKTDRVLTANIKSFKEKYIYNGHIFPSYALWGTVTGRTSSKNPNGQNIPKRGKVAKAYRKIFIAPPGYVILEADLSQAELRISADMANDRTMLGIYNSGGDIHAVTAASTMGISIEEFYELSKDERSLARFKAKAVNFGFIYGMGWRKFIGYAKTQYGVEFTEEEAQHIRETFFKTYSALPAWHRRMRQLAHKDLQVRSYSGRIRHLPMVLSGDDGISSEAERQAINSPVQEFASSLGVMAIGRLDQEIDPRFLAPTGFVHDAIYARVPLEYLEWGAKTLKYYMESNDIYGAFGVRMKCPIVADVGFGLNGAEVYEMEGLKLDQRFDFSAIEDLSINLPTQKIPPNNGRIITPEYMKVYA